MIRERLLEVCTWTSSQPWHCVSYIIMNHVIIQRITDDFFRWGYDDRRRRRRRSDGRRKKNWFSIFLMFYSIEWNVALASTHTRKETSESVDGLRSNMRGEYEMTLKSNGWMDVDKCEEDEENKNRGTFILYSTFKSTINIFIITLARPHSPKKNSARHKMNYRWHTKIKSSTLNKLDLTRLCGVQHTAPWDRKIQEIKDWQ